MTSAIPEPFPRNVIEDASRGTTLFSTAVRVSFASPDEAFVAALMLVLATKSSAETLKSAPQRLLLQRSLACHEETGKKNQGLTLSLSQKVPYSDSKMFFSTQ